MGLLNLFKYKKEKSTLPFDDELDLPPSPPNLHDTHINETQNLKLDIGDIGSSYSNDEFSELMPLETDELQTNLPKHKDTLISENQQFPTKQQPLLYPSSYHTSDEEKQKITVPTSVNNKTDFTPRITGQPNYFKTPSSEMQQFSYGSAYSTKRLPETEIAHNLKQTQLTDNQSSYEEDEGYVATEEQIGAPPNVAPLFLKMEIFKQINQHLNQIRVDLKRSEDEINLLLDVSSNREREFERWRFCLEDMQKKLFYIDKTLFKGD